MAKGIRCGLRRITLAICYDRSPLVPYLELIADNETEATETPNGAGAGSESTRVVLEESPDVPTTSLLGLDSARYDLGL